MLCTQVKIIRCKLRAARGSVYVELTWLIRHSLEGWQIKRKNRWKRKGKLLYTHLYICCKVIRQQIEIVHAFARQKVKCHCLQTSRARTCTIDDKYNFGTGKIQEKKWQNLLFSSRFLLLLCRKILWPFILVTYRHYLTVLLIVPTQLSLIITQVIMQIRAGLCVIISYNEGKCGVLTCNPNLNTWRSSSTLICFEQALCN